MDEKYEKLYSYGKSLTQDLQAVQDHLYRALCQSEAEKAVENWEKAKNLGSKINSKQMDYCPFYDVTSQTLYFTSKRKTENENKVSNLQEFQTLISTYENGLSRIYKYKIKI